MAAGDISFGLTTHDLKQMASVTSPTTVLHADSGGHMVIPGGTMLLTAEFSQAGNDLVIKGADGSTTVVQDYFSVGTSPTLQTAGGASMPPDMIDRLAHVGAPLQVAQQGGAIGNQPIGTVETATGAAFAIRADGTRVQLSVGDKVYQGDVMETGRDGALAVTFVDNSTFTVGGGARMVLDELVYDATSHTGTSAFSVVQGVFSFVSGAIAKSGSDAMTVRTPVATIGIRGTQVAVQAAAEGEANTITLLQEQTGILIVYKG